jgi:hypothetical protein
MRNPRRVELHHNGSGPGLALGPAPRAGSAVDELLLKLAEGFRERMPERRLQVFREALEGLPLEAVRVAYETVRDSDTLDRLPPPGQLRALAVRAQQAARSRAPAPQDLEKGRATPEEIDEVFAELQQAHPDRPFVYVIVAEHAQRYKGTHPTTARNDPGHDSRDRHAQRSDRPNRRSPRPQAGEDSSATAS